MLTQFQQATVKGNQRIDIANIIGRHQDQRPGGRLDFSALRSQIGYVLLGRL